MRPDDAAPRLLYTDNTLAAFGLAAGVAIAPDRATATDGLVDG